MLGKTPPFSIIDMLDARLQDTAYRKSEKTKFALMKAAAQLLSVQPLGDIRNIDICRQANLSAGVLNTYFADKHELIADLLGLFVDCMRDEYKAHRAELQDETDNYVRIFRTVDYRIGVSQLNPGIFRLLVIESPDFPNADIVRLRVAASQFWHKNLAEMIPDERAGIKLSKRNKFFSAALLGALVDEAIRFELYERENSRNFSLQNRVEIIAVLRYSAIYGADPSPASIEKARTRA